MPDHIPGLLLSERFYHEAVRPLLERAFPGLVHSAALIGHGSEILGFDTPRSMDHHWGLRLQLFLRPEDHAALAGRVDEVLRQGLPVSFLGFSTNFSAPDPNDNGVQHVVMLDHGPVNHMVEITTAARFFSADLGIDPLDDLRPADWLTFEETRLRGLTQGRVYHDGTGDLAARRARLAWYPRDLWLYLLAAEWQKISQEEPFVGRTGEVGDDLGSRLVTARLVHSLMRLGFLMERQYPAYSKWFGTAFARLDCAARLTPCLAAALAGEDWKAREAGLVRAYTIAAEMHNALALTAPVATQPTLFFGRPFLVIHGDEFSSRLRAAIADPAIRALPLVGSSNTFSTSVDLIDDPSTIRHLKGLYE